MIRVPTEIKDNLFDVDAIKGFVLSMYSNEFFIRLKKSINTNIILHHYIEKVVDRLLSNNNKDLFANAYKLYKENYLKDDMDGDKTFIEKIKSSEYRYYYDRVKNIFDEIIGDKNEIK